MHVSTLQPEVNEDGNEDDFFTLTAKAALGLRMMAAGLMAASQAGAQAVAARIAAPVANSERATLTGSLQPRARAEFDAGRMPAATRLNGMSLFFSRSAEQQAGLKALIAAQQNPASPLYHQWLTPDQFAARFGLNDADLAKVQDWLVQQGFSIDSVARSRNAIHFSGTAGQVEQAFSTEMHYYNVEGKQHFAPSTELSIPAALAPVVLAVGNLNDFHPRPMHILPAHPQFTSSQSGSVHFAPGDIKVVYNIPSTYTGVGQSIAIMGQSAVLTSDIENFENAASLPTKDPIMVLVPGTGSSEIDPLQSGDESESDIDLEWSGAIAPGASLFFVYTGSYGNSGGVFTSIEYAVDEDIAPIISISYGACEPEFGSSNYQMAESIFLQAATQGQSIIASSGDSGSTACYGDYGNTNDTAPVAADEALAVNYPASSAYVTAAGGTEIPANDDVTTNGYWEAVPSGGGDILTSALQWIPEVAWNDDALTAAHRSHRASGRMRSHRAAAASVRWLTGRAGRAASPALPPAPCAWFRISPSTHRPTIRAIFSAPAIRKTTSTAVARTASATPTTNT